jgi:hypothetical protein
VTGAVLELATVQSVLDGAVAAAELDARVHGIAADVAAVPAQGRFHHEEALDWALEIQGLGALFRHRRQVDALGRLRHS